MQHLPMPLPEGAKPKAEGTRTVRQILDGELAGQLRRHVGSRHPRGRSATVRPPPAGACGAEPRGRAAEPRRPVERAEHQLDIRSSPPARAHRAVGHPASTSAAPDHDRGSRPGRGCATADPPLGMCDAETPLPPSPLPGRPQPRRGRAGPPPPNARDSRRLRERRGRARYGPLCAVAGRRSRTGR
jgi:hypothetical protein